MKKLITTVAGLMIATSASAKSLPEMPAGCAQDIAVKGFCSGFSTSGVTSGSVTATIFAVIDAARFPDAQSLYERYVDFDQWGDFAANSGSPDVFFNASKRMPSEKDENGKEVIKHYFSYEINSPIGFQKVRAVSDYRLVDAYEGAELSLEFVVNTQGQQTVPAGEEPLNGAVGVKSQTGVVHAISCSTTELCGEGEIMIAYNSEVRPAIDLLPSLAGPAITAGSEAILIGMFLVDDSIDGDVL
jgi:hypothetical protein